MLCPALQALKAESITRLGWVVRLIQSEARQPAVFANAAQLAKTAGACCYACQVGLACTASCRAARPSACFFAKTSSSHTHDGLTLTDHIDICSPQSDPREQHVHPSKPEHYTPPDSASAFSSRPPMPGSCSTPCLARPAMPCGQTPAWRSTNRNRRRRAWLRCGATLPRPACSPSTA